MNEVNHLISKLPDIYARGKTDIQIVWSFANVKNCFAWVVPRVDLRRPLA